MNKTVVFIHGAWMTPLCWEKFKGFFESKDYSCHAPAWPYRDKSIDDLRKNPPAQLAGLGLKEITNHYDLFVRALDQPPILIGHSFGGLIVQILLDRGLGSSGVAIHPAPPKGVLPFKGSVIKANAGVLTTWGGWKKIVQLSFEQFQYAFVNTIPLASQRETYERYVVPETGRIFFQAAMAMTDGQSPLAINFTNQTRSPLLIIAGSEDNIVPPSLNKRNLEKYVRSTARTDYKEFAGRTHWTIGQDGWEEVAGYIEEWLELEVEKKK